MKKTRVLLIAVLMLALLMAVSVLSAGAEEGETERMLTVQEALAEGYYIRCGETNSTDAYPESSYWKDQESAPQDGAQYAIRWAIEMTKASDTSEENPAILTLLSDAYFGKSCWAGQTSDRKIVIKSLEGHTYSINTDPAFTVASNKLHFWFDGSNYHFTFENVNINLVNTSLAYLSKNGAKITLGAGATLTYTNTVGEDGYSKEVGGYGVAWVDGVLTVKDGAKIVIADAVPKSATGNALFGGSGTINFEPGAILDVKNTTRPVFGGSKTSVVNFAGTADIDNVKFFVSYAPGDTQASTFNILDGAVVNVIKHSGEFFKLSGTVTLNIKGGTINDNQDTWTSFITTYEAGVDNAQGGKDYYGGTKINVTGGTLNFGGQSTFANLYEGTVVTISGGTFNYTASPTNAANYGFAISAPASGKASSIVITGGTFNYNAPNQLFRLKAGVVDISGGEFNYNTAKDGRAIAKIETGASMIISGGVFKNESAVASMFDVNAGSLNISGGEFYQNGAGEKSLIDQTKDSAVAITGENPEDVKFFVKGNNYLITSGKSTGEGGKVILSGATIAFERTDLVLCKSYAEELTLVGVKFAEGITPSTVLGKKGTGSETVNVVKLELDGLCYGFTNAGTDIAATEDGGTFNVTEDLWAYDAVIDGKTVTIEGVAKADGSYPTITIPAGKLFELKNGAKVILDKVNIKTSDGGVFTIVGSADANAPTTVVIGADANIVSSDSKSAGYMIKIDGGYADLTINGKISYTDNTSGKEFVVIDAGESAWVGTITVAGEIVANASQKTAEYHLINAKGNGGTVKILDGAVLSMTLTGAADSANGIDALICNSGTTEIGAADLTSTAGVLYASADGANLVLTSDPKVDLSGVTGKFFATACRDVNLNAADALYLDCTVRIGGTYYMSLNAALAAAQDGDVIELLADSYTIYTAITVDKKITITGTKFDDGSVTAIDEQVSTWVFTVSETGAITLKNINLTTNGALALNNGGKVELGDGFYMSANLSQDRLIRSYAGEVVLDNAELVIVNSTVNVIRMEANSKLTMNNSNITLSKCSKEGIVLLGCEFVMNGGSAYGAGAISNKVFWIGDGSNLTFNDAKVHSVAQISILVQNNNVADAVSYITFNGGVYEQNGRNFVQMINDCRIVVNGGTFIGDTSGASSSRAGFFEIYSKGGPGNVTFNGGVFLFDGTRPALFYEGKNADHILRVGYVANAKNVMSWGGKQYFYMFYTDGAANAPVVGETTADSVLNLDATAPGLVFTATMSKDVFDANKTLGTTVKYGALVTTSADLLKAGAFTKAAIEAVGGQVINVVLTDADIVVGDTTVTITIKVTGLTNDQLKAALTIVPYVEIDGEVAYGSVQSSNAFSLYEIVISKLNDVVEIANDTYQYASAYIAGTFSPYTADMQAALQALVPHDHKLDNKGVCTICSANYANDLGSDDEADVTFGYGTTAHVFKLTLKANASYIFRLSNKVATLALYKADGTACALVNGVYACDAAGDYYLVVASKKIGSATVMVEHVHAYANGIGACSVCGETAEGFDADVMAEGVLTKGSKYLLSVDLAANTKYFIRALNLNVVVYDAQGNKVDTADNMINVTTAATYYLEVTCTFNGRIILAVETVCVYNYKGECNSCDADAPVVTVEKDKDASLVAIKGNSYFFTANLTAGNYTVACGASVGSVTVYNADGAVVTANEGKYNLTAGTYYVVVVANQTMTTTIKVAAAA